ncbi:MAG: glycosyl transferase [Prevotella sp.]|jgi:hypothetical protein|nr:glycosyl transferase [Prevotella sp.]
MIPKKIHYCWLSNDPMPEKLVKCMNSWKKYLPDYELVKWDLKRFPLSKNIWVKQAFESKRYAFAADYIRLYALSTEGGIYLDSDVEVLKSFDNLLDKPYFICKENSPQGLEAAIIGAEKGCEWVQKCLEYYDGKSFINENGDMSTTVLPAILRETISDSYSLVYIDNPSQIKRSVKEIYVLPSDYFSPKNYVTKKLEVTKNTYTIHHFAGSWQPKWKRILLLAWVPFSVKFPNVASFLKEHI